MTVVPQLLRFCDNFVAFYALLSRAEAQNSEGSSAAKNFLKLVPTYSNKKKKLLRNVPFPPKQQRQKIVRIETVFCRAHHMK